MFRVTRYVNMQTIQRMFRVTYAVQMLSLEVVHHLLSSVLALFGPWSKLVTHTLLWPLGDTLLTNAGS